MKSKLNIAVAVITVIIFACLGLTATGVAILAFREGLQVEGPAIYFAEPTTPATEAPAVVEAAPPTTPIASATPAAESMTTANGTTITVVMNTSTPAATEELPLLLVCPPASAGTNPVTGDPLIAELYPYPGVSCEYEYVNEYDDVLVNIPDGTAALIADWGVTCPEGALCEGTWVATKSFRLPAGILVHVFLYTSAEAAQGRFPSFAAEYVAQGHTDANVRVPTWAAGFGNVDGYAK